MISVDVSDWTSPGSTGRPAMECSREEFVREAWSQLKRSVNGEKELLLDEDLHSWFLDPDIRDDKTRSDFLRNVEPLLVNLENTWALRPEATTAIPNLFLASDYVRTYTDLATMEGANEAARRAVNGILDDVKFDGPRCEVWPLHQLELLAPWRLHDEMQFKAGLPWDDSLVHVAERAIGGTPLLEQVRPLLVAVSPFVSPIAEALDPETQHIEDVKESTGVDAPLRLALVEAPALQDALVGAPGLMPGASEILGPGGFIERLGWYREMISDTLIAAVPTWEPQRHLYGLVSDFVSRSGKGLRPALCIATTRALGGRAEDAFPAAAGLEMLHNAFLVHDDIEDESESRRGVATMHRRVGIPIAVNVGDEMNALSMRLFRKAAERLGPVTAFRILDEVDHLLVETLEGQAMELGWVRDNNLTLGVDDYLRLVLKKTAWYSFIHPMRIGALIANGEDQNLSRFDRFGYLTGLAFHNLGHPVNDLFDLRTDGRRSQENDDESATVKASDPAEKASRQGIECRHGGSNHDQPVCHSTHLSLHERTDLVEVRKGHRPQSLRRCSGPGASRSDSGSKANGQRDPEVVGSLGPGTSPDPTP